MKTKKYLGRSALTTLTIGIVTMLPSPSLADNPIVQTSYTADPAPMVHEGRLYLYTSHDEDVTVSNFYTMNDWRLYSTVDMVNWTDHGSPAGYKTFSWGTGDAWAPQGIARDGKYFLYVPLNNATGAKIGVGVSNNPAGPFTDPLGKALAATGTGNIDPTVFVDDDGQAYMYWGNATLRYVKLNADMTSYSGSVTNVSVNGFLEGPWFYKRESLYYMVYAATGTGSEKLSYATSTSPTGPWTVRGDIMDSGKTFTNHPGVVDFKGHSYLFYHNGTLPGGNDYRRSVCVEEFTYGSDGSIPKLTMSTKGPSGIAALDPFQQVEAETIAFSAGLKTEVCTDTGAGMNVTSVSNGDYIKVKDVDFGTGVSSFDARVSSAKSNSAIELHLDSQTGTLLGTCDVSSASSSWTTKTCAVSGATGKHDLFFKFTGGSGDLFKFNWWKFTSLDGTGSTGAGGGAGSSSGGTGAIAVATGGRTSGAGGRAGGAGGTTLTSSGGRVQVGGGGTATSAGSAGSGSAAAGSSAAGSAGSGSAAAGSAGSSSAGAKGGASGAGGTRVVASSGSSTSTSGDQAGTAGSASSCSCKVGTQTGAGSGALLLVAAALLLRRGPGRKAQGAGRR